MKITELAQRMKAAAVRAKTATEEYASGHMSVSVCFAECEEFNRLTDGPDNIIALVDALEKAQTISAAAEKLVRCKCRYHSEQNYRALAALFGVTAPDLPPLNSESRTVKLVDCDFGAVQHMSGGSTEYCHGFVDGTQNAIRAITAAGIKWEAE